MAAKSDGMGGTASVSLQNLGQRPAESECGERGLLSSPAGALAPAAASSSSSHCCEPGPGCCHSSCVNSVPRQREEYSLADCCWILGALLVFFSDGATDVWLAVDYYFQGDYWWFGLTLIFVVVPSLVVQVLSFRWFVYDYTNSGGGSCARARAAAAAAGGGTGRDEAADHFSTKESDAGQRRTTCTSTCCRLCMWFLQSLVHILQLGQVWRYLRAMYLGIQSRWHKEHERRHFYWRMMFESADINMLRLLETFLKSAPQLVLQLSIMVQTNHIGTLQGLSAAASLLSLAWMIASYQKILRESRDDKMPMSYKAAITQILWHLFTIAARVIAFSLFASVFQLYFGIFIVSHWCIMTFWIIHGETDFCMSKWEEIIYNMVVGIIYIFCWFNVKEGRTRCRMLIYYFITFCENAALTVLWYLYRDSRTTDFEALIIVCVVFSSFALGIFFMFIYYGALHPNGPMFGSQGGCIGGEQDTATHIPAQVITVPPRAMTQCRTTVGEQVPADRDSCIPVFQVRPSVPPTPVSRTLRTEGPVIRIDLPRKRYPAWDAHFIDRRLRKTILALEYTSPATPRLQYRNLSFTHEVLEYETTV
ncbi:XK-related protein 7-like [Stegostoma tigrinum]|uniref:XK-related protein 7-like n=1 Tax=Stegostoma tigrinum TaxID=3053191 RepID=UPI00202B77B7|nr:XK-related protein 7-like [Stegostoma tigrinum]